MSTESSRVPLQAIAPSPWNRRATFALILSLPFQRTISVDMGLADLSVSDFLSAIGLLILATRTLMKTNGTWPRERSVLIGVSVYILAIMASSANAMDVGQTWRYLGSILLKCGALYLASSFIRSDSDIFTAAGLHVLACGIIAAAVVLQGLVALSTGNEGSFGGLFEARNEMILYVLPALPICLSMAVSAPKGRLAYTAACSLMAVAILLSRGRTGLFLSLLAPVLLMLALGKTRYKVLLRVTCSVAAVGLGIWLLGGNYEDFWDRVQNRFVYSIDDELRDNRGSSYLRLAVLERSLDALPDSLWIGIGAGNFKLNSASIVGLVGGHEIQPHNTYLGVLVETGVLGLCGFALLLASGLPAILRLRSSPSEAAVPAAGYAVAYLLVLAYIAFFDASDRYGLWLIMGSWLGAARFVVASRHPPAASATREA